MRYLRPLIFPVIFALSHYLYGISENIIQPLGSLVFGVSASLGALGVVLIVYIVFSLLKGK